MSWSELLREARLKGKQSQTDLARRAGVSRKTISSYELAASDPRRDTLLKLAIGLGLSRESTNTLLVAASFDEVAIGRLGVAERRRTPFPAQQEEIDR